MQGDVASPLVIGRFKFQPADFLRHSGTVRRTGPGNPEPRAMPASLDSGFARHSASKTRVNALLARARNDEEARVIARILCRPRVGQPSLLRSFGWQAVSCEGCPPKPCAKAGVRNRPYFLTARGRRPSLSPPRKKRGDGAPSGAPVFQSCRALL